MNARISSDRGTMVNFQRTDTKVDPHSHSSVLKSHKVMMVNMKLVSGFSLCTSVPVTKNFLTVDPNVLYGKLFRRSQ